MNQKQIKDFIIIIVKYSAWFNLYACACFCPCWWRDIRHLFFSPCGVVIRSSVFQ